MVKVRHRLPTNRYPATAEWQYRNELKMVVKHFRSLCETIMFPQLEGWVSGADHRQPLRQDADDWQEQLNNSIRRILDAMKKPNKAAMEAAASYADDVDDNAKRNWQRTIRAAYGVDPTTRDQARYDKLMDLWGQVNSNLITNISEKAAGQIKDEVVKALQSGTTVDDLKDIIQERIDVSDSRAELIARDQIGKLNGDLNEEIHRENGVDSYIWRTVGDERVRDTHRDCDNKSFSYDKDGSLDSDAEKPDGNDPGQDFQCRCWAEPILASFMAFELSLQGAK